MTKKTESAGGIVINAEREIVLVRNGPGAPWWGFPKGHIDKGEGVLEAAKREIYEESGLKEIQYVCPLGSYERYKGKPGGGDDLSELKKIHMFLFRTEKHPVSPIDSGNPEARWVPIDGVESQLTNENDKNFFRSIREKLS